jgi:hypothetical protein
MRMITIVEATNLNALGNKLFGELPNGSRHFEELRALNPHVDIDRIESGSVLLLPDVASQTANGSVSVFADGFESFDEKIRLLLNALTEDLKVDNELTQADFDEVVKMNKLALRKGFLDRAPELKVQVEATSVAQKKSLRDFKQAFETLELIRNESAAELDLLRKILG